MINKKVGGIFIIAVSLLSIFFIVYLLNGVSLNNGISGNAVDGAENNIVFWNGNEYKHYELSFNTQNYSFIRITILNTNLSSGSYFYINNLRATPYLNISNFGNEYYNHFIDWNQVGYKLENTNWKGMGILDLPNSDGLRVLASYSKQPLIEMYINKSTLNNQNFDNFVNYTISFDARVVAGNFIFRVDGPRSSLLNFITSDFVDFPNALICDMTDGNCVNTNLDKKYGVFWYNFYSMQNRTFFPINRIYSAPMICESNKNICDVSDYEFSEDYSKSLFLLAPCSSNSFGLCLVVDSGAEKTKEIIISSNASICPDKLSSDRSLIVIGNHSGDVNPEISVGYCEAINPPIAVNITPGSGEIQVSTRANALAIVDISKGEIIAKTIGPRIEEKYEQGLVGKWAYINVLNGPDGKKYPFFAPASDGDLSSAFGRGDFGTFLWKYMCIYSPEKGIEESRCGKNFIEVSLNNSDGSPYGFRELGGYMQDLDNDGWEDITLLYHFQNMVFSGKTGELLNSITLNFKQLVEPGPPISPHSGRNYGNWIVTYTRDGRVRSVFTSTVISTVAVIDQLQKNSTNRNITWSKFFLWGATDFVGPYKQEYLDDGSYKNSSIMRREGDALNGFSFPVSNPLLSLDNGQGVIVINRYFINNFTGHPCDAALYEYRIHQNESSMQNNPYYLAKNRCEEDWRKITLGRWEIELLDENSGEILNIKNFSFLFGYSNKIVPGNKKIFVVEDFDSLVTYNSYFDINPKYLNFYTYNNSFELIGTSPIALKPRIFNVPPERNLAAGDSGPEYINELYLKDIDEDGLMEIQLVNGKWIGYSLKSNQFVVKSDEFFCGDGYCNDGEDCSSCSADCGSCPASPSNPSSGGGGSGGGSSGGGGGYFPSRNVVLTINNTIAPSEPEKPKIGTSYDFVYGDETHEITLLSIEGKNVIIRVSSEPFNVKISEGEVVPVDLNGDGKLDIVVTMKNVEGNKINLEITKYISSNNFSSSLVIMLIIFAIIVIIIILIVIWIFLKKMKKDRLSPKSFVG